MRGFHGDIDLDLGSPRKGKSPIKGAPLANKEKDVLQHRNQTVVTPRVGRISQRLFEQTLKVAGRVSPEDDLLCDAGLTQAMDDAKAHHSNPLSMQWSNPSHHKGFYNSVVMDGVVYNVSSHSERRFVWMLMMRPGWRSRDGLSRHRRKSSPG